MSHSLQPPNRRRMIYILMLATACVAAGIAAYPYIADKLAQHRIARVKANYRTLVMAMASLGLDNCGVWLPDDTHIRRLADPSLPLTFEHTPGFQQRGKLMWGMRCLTTPIAYLPALPQDPFNPGQDYAYTTFRSKPVSRGNPNFLAVLSSPGPDGKFDLPLLDLRAGISDLLYTTTPTQHGLSLSPQERGIIRHWIAPHLYDPTNGVRSGGDLIQVVERNYMGYGFSGYSSLWNDEDKIVPPDRPVALTRQNADRPATAADSAATSPTQEEKAWIFRTGIPRELAKILDAANMIKMKGESLNEEHRHRLSNHLGAFREFFDHPRPMREAGFAATLKAWKEEDPEWWTATAKPMPETAEFRGRQMNGWSFRAGFQELTAYDIYPILILYGKTQLLLAAEEAGGQATQDALHRISVLRQIIGPKGIDGCEHLIKHDATIARIHEELHRLCDELERSIKEKATAQPNPKAEHHS